VTRILIASVVVMALAAGCGSKNKTASTGSQDSLAGIAPPPPVHPTTPQAAPVVPVTPVDVAPVPENHVASGQRYVVKKGDTLWSLAQKTYGDGKQYKRISSANPSIKNDKLVAGQTIVLP